MQADRCCSLCRRFEFFDHADADAADADVHRHHRRYGDAVIQTDTGPLEEAFCKYPIPVAFARIKTAEDKLFPVFALHQFQHLVDDDIKHFFVIGSGFDPAQLIFRKAQYGAQPQPVAQRSTQSCHRAAADQGFDCGQSENDVATFF